MAFGVNKHGDGVTGGALYDDGANAWTSISANGAPSPRTDIAWAWTGSELVIFGGALNGGSVTNDGYAYNPATDSWRKLNLMGAPSARAGAFATWTGSEVLVWGGRDGGGAALSNGARYHPPTDAWANLTSTGAPAARQAPQRRTGWAAFSSALGRGVFVGGMTATFFHDGGLYTPSGDAWPNLVPAWPSGRDHEFGAEVWTGSEIVLWSGLSAGAVQLGGERYNP